MEAFSITEYRTVLLLIVVLSDMILIIAVHTFSLVSDL